MILIFTSLLQLLTTMLQQNGSDYGRKNLLSYKFTIPCFKKREFVHHIEILSKASPPPILQKQ